MNPTISSDPSGTFRLEGTLGIYSAELLLSTLTDCLASSHMIVLDLEGVDNCDTAGLQLLLSARASAVEHRKTVQFRAVPEAIATCCRRLGLPVLA